MVESTEFVFQIEVKCASFALAPTSTMTSTQLKYTHLSGNIVPFKTKRCSHDTSLSLGGKFIESCCGQWLLCNKCTRDGSILGGGRSSAVVRSFKKKKSDVSTVKNKSNKNSSSSTMCCIVATSSESTTSPLSTIHA